MKLLSKGAPLTIPLHIEVSKASQSAISAVESLGGKLVTAHYNQLGIRAHLKPHKYDRIPLRAFPKPKEMAYYISDQNRGYLSPLIQSTLGGGGGEKKLNLPKLPGQKDAIKAALVDKFGEDFIEEYKKSA